MERQIHITEIVAHCVTRARGEEAARKLLGYLEVSPVEIDLNGVEMVSLSFLDGLLSFIASYYKKPNIIFQIDRPDIEKKLAHIASIRHTDINYRYVKQPVQHVEPRPPRSSKTTFVPA